MKYFDKIWKISGIIVIASAIVLVISLGFTSYFPEYKIFEIITWTSTITFLLAFAVNISYTSKQPPP